MIVVEIRLQSAIGRDRDSDLGTMVIDNVTTKEKLAENGGRSCDYRCRMYRKGALLKAGGKAVLMALSTRPTRETIVENHARHALPVQSLVAKALSGMGYG